MMKNKVLFILLLGGLIAGAAWLVAGNNPRDRNPQNRLRSIAQGAEPEPAQADAVPEKYRDTVHKGLEYLAKSQHKDGHWEGDGGQHPVAMTGLAGLALLMEHGQTQGFRDFRQPKYSANINKAVDWLVDMSQAGRDGLIYSDHPSETARYMQGHGLATLFLAGVCQHAQNDTRRKKLTDVLTRAVKYIVKAQSSQGGWYDTSKVEGHDFDTIIATVIQIQALQAAENFGIPVPDETRGQAPARTRAFFCHSRERGNPSARIIIKSLKHGSWPSPG